MTADPIEPESCGRPNAGRRHFRTLPRYSGHLVVTFHSPSLRTGPPSPRYRDDMPRSAVVENAPRVARLLAAARCIVGLGALLSPRLVSTPWLGRKESQRFPIRIFARVLGGRDVALGAAVLAANSDEELKRLCALGAAADGVDFFATLHEFPRLPRVGRWLVLGSTFGAALCGAACSALIQKRLTNAG